MIHYLTCPAKYTGNFILENTLAKKANQIVELISLQKLCQECKLLLTWRLIDVVQFFLLIFSITITFPKGVSRFHHDKGTSLSLLIVSIRWHFSYTGYRLLNVTWSTAVFSNFRNPSGEFWVSPAIVVTAEVTIWSLAGPAPSWL